MVARTRPQIGQRWPVFFGGSGGFGNDDSGGSGRSCVGRSHTCSYSRTGCSLAEIVCSCRGTPCGFSKDLKAPRIYGGRFFVVSSVGLACRPRNIFLVGSLSIIVILRCEGYDSDYITSYLVEDKDVFMSELTICSQD